MFQVVLSPSGSSSSANSSASPGWHRLPPTSCHVRGCYNKLLYNRPQLAVCYVDFRPFMGGKLINSILITATRGPPSGRWLKWVFLISKHRPREMPKKSRFPSLKYPQNEESMPILFHGGWLKNYILSENTYLLTGLSFLRALKWVKMMKNMLLKSVTCDVFDSFGAMPTTQSRLQRWPSF